MRSILLALLIFSAAPLQAALVTFDDMAPTSFCGGGGVECIDSITTPQGFVFSHMGIPGSAEIYIPTNGPTGNYIATAGRPDAPVDMRIEHQNGVAFDLDSLDINRIAESLSNPAGAFSIYGYDQQDNLIAFLSASTYVSPTGGWTNLVFDDSWNSVHSVVVESFYTSNGFGSFFMYPRIDNVSVNVVPLPAAVWLFGSALAGLGWLRRTRHASNREAQD